jgi:deoxyribodipyrimidine photo-lyase
MITPQSTSPDFQELHYPQPIVEHVFARERAIRVYKEALG